MTALKTSAAAALLGLFVLATAHPALAEYVNRWVYNKTDHCVWFTIDARNTNFTQWSNTGSAFVPPGKTHTFNVETNAYLKVRAEPRKGAACDQTKIADIEITESTTFGSMLGPSETTIHGGSGKPFGLRWGK